EPTAECFELFDGFAIIDELIYLILIRSCRGRADELAKPKTRIDHERNTACRHRAFYGLKKLRRGSPVIVVGDDNRISRFAGFGGGFDQPVGRLRIELFLRLVIDPDDLLVDRML